MRERVLVICGSVLLIAGAATVARAGTNFVPIPGLAGPTLRVPAALRTGDGGAILLAGIPRHPGARTGRTLTARVEADGTLDLGYGYEGVARLALGPGAIPTALAIDPETGDAWIGATSGGRSEVFAVDETGRRQPRFGTRGTVRLPAADDGGVSSLAWGHGELLAAAGGPGRCAGCTLTLLDAANGRVITTGTLTSEAAGGATCTGPVGVTSVAFGQAGGFLAATSVANPTGCTASLLALGNSLAPLGAYGPNAPPPPTRPLRSVLITPEAGAACVAGSGPAGIGVWPLGGAQATRIAAGASAKLVALVPLGPGSCGALLQSGRQSAEVAQIGPSDPAPAISRIPSGLAPLSMFRCHQHLLVVAANGPAAHERAVIVPVPISRGPFAEAVVARSAPTTGCG